MNFSVVSENWLYLAVGAYPYGPLGGVALTVVLSILSAVFSGILGLSFGILLSITRGPVHILLLSIIGFFRAIPVLLLIFWTYFLLPMLFGLNAPGTTTVVCALSLIGGAYLAQSVYAGLQSLPQGQWHAARSLGFSTAQCLRYVLLPQALSRMLPSFINQWVSLVKDSSLAYVIGVPELSFVAAQTNGRTMMYPAEIFLFVACIYYLICATLDLCASLVSRRMKYLSVATQ